MPSSLSSSALARNRARVALLALVLAGCTGAPLSDPALTPSGFPVCHGYGCAQKDTVRLSPEEWRAVRSLFEPPATDAADERGRIARAVGRMEKLVGPKTGTEHDKGGTFPGLFEEGQMDCIDESTNTTTYLKMFAGDGLLRWHTVGPTVTRGYFIFGWPHTTATVRDRATGEEYAVDSWFFDNGADAVVVPLKPWRDGWSPPETKR